MDGMKTSIFPSERMHRCYLWETDTWCPTGQSLCLLLCTIIYPSQTISNHLTKLLKMSKSTISLWTGSCFCYLRKRWRVSTSMLVTPILNLPGLHSTLKPLRPARDGSAVKRTSCSYRRLGFSSQHPNSDTQLLTPASCSKIAMFLFPRQIICMYQSQA